MLLADMESFNSAPVRKNMNTGRKIEIEVEPENTLEKKVDALTDKLRNAFDSGTDVKSEDLNKDEDLGNLCLFIQNDNIH